MTENDNDDWKKEVEATWVRKTIENSPEFDILKGKKVFVEVRRSFMDDGASTSIAQPSQKDSPKIISVVTREVDLNILKSFLQTCMKLLRNERVVEGL